MAPQAREFLDAFRLSHEVSQNAQHSTGHVLAKVPRGVAYDLEARVAVLSSSHSPDADSLV